LTRFTPAINIPVGTISLSILGSCNQLREAFMAKLTFKAERLAQIDDAREMPAYTTSEAAHYLCIPKATINAWVKGTTYTVRGDSKQFHRVIELPDKTLSLLSFYNLAEAHVLRALRTEYEIPLPVIRKALGYIRKEFGWERPLIQEKFCTDGVTLFVERLGTLIDTAHPEQGLLPLLTEYLDRIEWEDEFAARLYPFTRVVRGTASPRAIVIDPMRSFGRPLLDRLGVTTNVIAERYKAGDSITKLVEEYGGAEADIEEAIRCELHIGLAA
jgi:uncharacterized protein (DUF433 family)